MQKDRDLPRFFIEGKKANKSDAELKEIIANSIINESEDYKENLDLMAEFYFTFYSEIYG